MSINRQHWWPLRLARLALALFFVAAGVLHFVRTDSYLELMPPYLPYHLALVYVSGVFEILGGACILIPGLRRIAGWGLIALLVAVFPANVQMAIDVFHGKTFTVLASLPPRAATWVAILRLPLQIPLIWWVYSCMRD
jgi:uncharacterized membrane protein